VILRVLDRLARQRVVIQEAVGFLADQRRARRFHAHPPRLRRLVEHALHHFAEVDDAARGHAGNVHLADRGALRIADGDLDLLVLQLTVAKHAPKLGLGVGTRGLAHERVHQPVLGGKLGTRLHVTPADVAQHVEADLNEVAHNAVHVAADIADLGEFGCLDLQERRLRQLCEPARDLGLAAAGRADHQDVLWHHLLADALGELRTAPAVAQRNGDRALGVGLAHDEAVELGDDLARGIGRNVHQLSSLSTAGVPSVSTMTEWLVYTQISPAIRIARRATASADSPSTVSSARAAARA